MLYCYRRLNLLEKSVIEHGKILQNFIINYNIQMQHFSLLNKSLHNIKNNDINVENNRTEYVEFDKIKKINLGEKISVSDDEDDEDGEDEDDEDEDDEDEDGEDEDGEDEDDEDEDEDGEDEEDDEEDEDEDDTKKNIIKDNLENLIISNNNLEQEEVEDSISVENIKFNEQTITTIDDETFINNLPINLKSFTLETNNDAKIINLENIDNSNDKTGEKKNYSKMKVDDLKSLVVTKNLTDNETSQKMKKSDLVKLLQNQ